jgi:hypothetical protein
MMPMAIPGMVLGAVRLVHAGLARAIGRSQAWRMR